MMATWSLRARLACAFACVVTAVFVVTGVAIFGMLSSQVYRQDDTSIVLAARHLRRLAAELDDRAAVLAHQERLTILVLGDPALALRITDGQGAPLVDYDPPHIVIPDLPIHDAAQRLVEKQVHAWRDGDNEPSRGIATYATLKDGSSVVIRVARSMRDREAMLAHDCSVLVSVVVVGILAAILLGYLAVSRLLRPLKQMAERAGAVTPTRLDQRIGTGSMPGELAGLVQALDGMLDRLQGGFERMWHFTADLAHDMRTPINNIRGASEVALTRERNAGYYQTVLESSIEECERLGKMIDNVLFLARAENPQFALHRQTFRVEAELRLLADYFEGVAADAGVTILVEGDAELHAERELFRRAVGNLLANALRYTLSGGTVFLRAAQDGGSVTVSVENPGVAIDPAVLVHVFDRFYRADKARSNAGSSAGLGLSIVKTITQLHGGHVDAVSAAGLTCFRMIFPSHEHPVP